MKSKVKIKDGSTSSFNDMRDPGNVGRRSIAFRICHYGFEEISKLFCAKYPSLYNSIPTSEEELYSLCDVMKVILMLLRKLVDTTPDIIQTCIRKISSVKDDGDTGFK